MQQTVGCITGRRLFAFIFTAVNTSAPILCLLSEEEGMSAGQSIKKSGGGPDCLMRPNRSLIRNT